MWVISYIKPIFVMNLYLTYFQMSRSKKKLEEYLISYLSFKQ